MNNDMLIERAQILLDQNRYKDAESYIRQALEKDPDNSDTLALLGRCYINNRRYDDGIEVLQRALAIEPNGSFYYYLLGFAFYHKNARIEARTHLEKAIQLNPYAAEYFGLLAHVLLEQRSFEAALEKANEGLALDAENITCLNARATALNKLKRQQDAVDTMNTALAKDPENEGTHNVVGWNLLERGRHEEAAGHFMEALRINPGYDNAKIGLKEALRSKILLYKWLLQYSFWVSNKGKNLQIVVPVVLYITFKVLIGMTKDSGSSTSLSILLAGLYILIVVVSWTIGSIANFVLLFHPMGKHSLSVDERWSALTAVPAMVLGLSIMLLSSFAGVGDNSAYEGGLFFAGLLCLSMALPLSHASFPLRLKGLSGRERFTAVLIGFGLLVLLLFTVAPTAAAMLFGMYALAFIIYNWTGLRR